MFPENEQNFPETSENYVISLITKGKSFHERTFKSQSL